MWLLDRFKKKVPETPAPPTPKAYVDGYAYNRVYGIPFNGEKNLGEIGPIIKYFLDYEGFRLRSWQLYLESEICQTVIKRFSRWVIGNGLKIQCEPQFDVLESEGIKGDYETFNKTTEARFRTFCNSRMADHGGQKSVHGIADEAFINSKVGGDILVILRYDKRVTIQLIDAANVVTPLGVNFNGVDYQLDNGNRIRNGEELDSKGNVIAYHVRKADELSFECDRIPAYGKSTGLLMAFMVKGLKYRLDNNRGIPLLAAVMETVKKMERYKEATVGSAEERQKIAYFITHGNNSLGENPILERAARAFGNSLNDDLPTDRDGNKIASNVAATTNKTVINLGLDSDIKALEADNELYFKDFYTVNIDLVCATVDIPPNVAMSKYDANFSASRAALKDWEHTLNVERKKFADQFYAPIYWFWLHIEILTNKIQAPGYMEAFMKGNWMAIEAYRHARFVGANVPHIDPEKEVRAERLKLGMEGENLPLTTTEAATEALNGGDYMANLKKFSKEKEEAEKLGINKEKEPDDSDDQTTGADRK